MEEGITLIVPVYNAARWLGECLASIAAQECSVPVRVLVIDDGSSDGSQAIARKFCEGDSRFEFIQAAHGGVSAARNLGIDRCDSRWIGFVDADDRLLPGALQTLLDALTENGAQVAVGQFVRRDKGVTADGGSPVCEVYDYEGAMREALYQRRIMNSPCGMLMERRLLGSDIRFREGIRFEDLDAFYRFYEPAQKIVYVRRTVYFYRENPEGFMETWNDSRLDALDVTDRMVEYMRGRHPELLPAALDRRFSAHYNAFLLLRRFGMIRPEIQKKCLRVIREGRARALRDPRVRLKNKLGALLSFLL